MVEVCRAGATSVLLLIGSSPWMLRVEREYGRRDGFGLGGWASEMFGLVDGSGWGAIVVDARAVPLLRVYMSMNDGTCKCLEWSKVQRRCDWV